MLNKKFLAIGFCAITLFIEQTIFCMEKDNTDEPINKLSKEEYHKLFEEQSKTTIEKASYVIHDNGNEKNCLRHGSIDPKVTFYTFDGEPVERIENLVYYNPDEMLDKTAPIDLSKIKEVAIEEVKEGETGGCIIS